MILNTSYRGKMWFIPLLLCTLAIRIHSEKISVKKRVCIIGAGPSGLASAKQISSLTDFEPVVFERNSNIGGQWLYTESGDVDNHGLPVNSGVYKYLRVNYPKEILAYPDYPELHGENRSYISHESFFEYFKNYTDNFHIRRFIRFDTLVEEVDFRKNTNNWNLKIKDLNTNAQNEILCEAVMVCSGYSYYQCYGDAYLSQMYMLQYYSTFFKPNVPKIPGIESFTGRVLHSHEYRRPEEFSNQTVVVLGASFSGLDISVDVSPFAQTIYLSSRHDKLNAELPANLEQVPGIVSAYKNQLILSNGSRINVDALIFCTGYLYSYSFLKPSSGIIIDSGKYVHPLHKQSINIEHPTMAFITVPMRCLYVQIAYVQAYYFAAVLQGKVKLPSRLEMLKELSDSEKNVPKSQKDRFLATFKYYDEFAQPSGAQPLPYYFKPALRLAVKNLAETPLHCKDKNLYLYANGSVDLK